MIECITETMRRKICNTIKYNDRKIAIITDESTSLSKKACLIVYVRARGGWTAGRKASWVMSF
jgi:hypothetical protein